MKSVRLLIGYLRRAHGIHGDILVKSLTDDDARFTVGLKCFLVKDSDADPHGEVTISRVRVTPSGLLIGFRGCDNRETARRYCGSYLAVRREDAIEIRDEDEFYTGDILGSRVSDRTRGDLGELVDLIDAGGSDVLVVRKLGERDVLIPFLKSIVQSVDIEANTIEVVLPEGLFELYRDTSDDVSSR